MLQGIIVVSDGRSTQFSAQTFEEVRARAQKSKVPIFTVAVGESRQPIYIRITDLQAPEQARPEDSFPVRVDVDGEGLAGQEVGVFLDVIKPNGDKVSLAPVLKPGESAVFKPGEPPHTQVEFEVEKPQLEGEWKLRARVPKDKREAFAGKEHVTDTVTVHVVKKPIRVLLAAGAPTRDYQFLRSLLVREVDRRRAELSIYIQLARPEIIQDVSADRLLQRFPSTLRGEDDPSEKADERFDNLSQYDLIVAFDLDWTQLSVEQAGLLERWVGTHAGGLVIVAGPVNTFELTRGVNYEKAKPILDLFPVYLDDSRLQGLGLERPTSEPWRLNFGPASAQLDFLKLNEESKEPLAGWEDFFAGRGEGPKEPGIRHGFYEYYPLKGVKPNAGIVATFADPRARLADGKEQPFLVTMPYGSGKVVYIGSGEVWRLRQYSEAFHERFWIKLARYAGSGNLSKTVRRGVLVMGKSFTANQFVRVEAQLFGREMLPLPRSERPKIQLRGPGGTPALPAVDMQAKPSAADNWNGWFAGRFLVTSPGAYELQLPIPGTADILTSKFVVKEANPEMDQAMPDFVQLQQLASEATEVLARNAEVRKKLEPILLRTNQRAALPAGNDSEALRLYFDLKGAEAIPECMVTDRRVHRSRGPIKDLWEEGFIVKDGEPPWKLSYALLAAVALLSLEWLTRKLLKLA